MMADEYIRKVDAVEETLKYTISSGVSNQSTWNECVRTIADTLQDMPSADVVQVRHGKWYHSECDKFKCGLCGYAFTVIQGADRMRYCPNCGAKMDEKTKKQSVMPADEYVRMHKDPEAAKKFWRNE